MPKNSPNLRSVEYECRTRNAYARCTAPTHTKKRGNTVQTNGVYRTKSVPGSGLAARAVCLFPCHSAASSSKSDLMHDTVGFLHPARVLPSSRKAALTKPLVEALPFFQNGPSTRDFAEVMQKPYRIVQRHFQDVNITRRPTGKTATEMNTRKYMPCHCAASLPNRVPGVTPIAFSIAPRRRPVRAFRPSG